MIELGPENLIEYLRQTGRLSDSITAASHAEVLSGGVSNVVMRVFVPDGQDFVVKQSRAQLRTKADWFSQPERIWRERDVLDALQHCTPPGVVPKLLFEDRDQFLLAMEALPREHVVWKNCLLQGEADVAIARQLGELLATIHARTAENADLQQRLGDRVIFDELRLDPFYRFVARRDPELRPSLERLIDETLATPVCLVLGDFSPKNILIIEPLADSRPLHASDRRRLALVDFETGHFGDPAFDLGFFLSHLLLKTIRNAARADQFFEMLRHFWNAYRATLCRPNRGGSDDPQESSNLSSHKGLGNRILPDVLQLAPFERRIVPHLAACMRARVDGKSMVDYLTGEAQALVREVTRDWLLSPPDGVEKAFADLRLRLKSACSC